MKNKLRLYQTQTLKLLPIQLQLIKLLELPTAELENEIKKEILENPALEEIPDNESIYDDNEELDINNENKINENQSQEYFHDIDENEILENIEEKNFQEKEISDYIDFYSDEIKENEDADNYFFNQKSDIPKFEFPSTKTFYDKLKEQLYFLELNEKEKIIAEYIIGNIDEKGFLTRDLEFIVDDLSLLYGLKTTTKEVEKVLKKIHNLDPPGVGARNIQECLLIQLSKMPQNEITKLAEIIISNYYQELTKKHYEKLKHKLRLTDNVLKKVINLISKLNINPADEYFDSFSILRNTITPDFIIDIIDNEIHVSLNNRNTPELRISPKVLNLIKQENKRKDIKYLKKYINRARLFIGTLKQRYITMLNVMKAIVLHQEEFFKTGDINTLKPLLLKDIADATNYDISTISRVISNKYVQTPYGIYPLKMFFSEGLKTINNEDVSSYIFKEKIKEIIENEDKSNPLSDEQVVEKLKEKGFKIARRTVTKYRQMLNIPPARLRKEL